MIFNRKSQLTVQGTTPTTVLASFGSSSASTCVRTPASYVVLMPLICCVCWAPPGEREGRRNRVGVRMLIYYGGINRTFEQKIPAWHRWCRLSVGRLARGKTRTLLRSPRREPFDFFHYSIARASSKQLFGSPFFVLWCMCFFSACKQAMHHVMHHTQPAYYRMSTLAITQSNVWVNVEW